MKYKIITAILMLVMVFVITEASVCAENSDEKVSGNCTYRVIDETTKSITLTRVLDYGEVVEIPASIDGYTVTNIGSERPADNKQVFFEATNAASEENAKIIKKLIIPEGVKVIEDFACSGLKGMTELKLPDSLERIEYGAFLYCDSLMNLELNSVSVGKCAFSKSNFGGKYSENYRNDYFDNIYINGYVDLLYGADDSPTFLATKNVYIDSDFDRGAYLNIYAENVYLSENVKRFSHNPYVKGERRDNTGKLFNALKNLYVSGKDTIIYDTTVVDADINEKIQFDNMIVCKDSKAEKYAKKNKINHTVIPDSITLKTSKSKSEGNFIFKWKKANIFKTIRKYKKNGKCIEKNIKMKVPYSIYAKNNDGKYSMIKSTYKNNWKTTKKAIKVRLEKRDRV